MASWQDSFVKGKIRQEDLESLAGYNKFLNKFLTELSNDEIAKNISECERIIKEWQTIYDEVTPAGVMLSKPFDGKWKAITGPFAPDPQTDYTGIIWPIDYVKGSPTLTTIGDVIKFLLNREKGPNPIKPTDYLRAPEGQVLTDPYKNGENRLYDELPDFVDDQIKNAITSQKWNKLKEILPSRYAHGEKITEEEFRKNQDKTYGYSADNRNSVQNNQVYSYTLYFRYLDVWEFLSELKSLQAKGGNKPVEPIAASQSVAPSPTQSGTQSAVDPKSINSKVTLKIKTGPTDGLLIGNVERDIVDGSVDLNGLQFDKPGQYVISIIPSSSDIEETEITINVDPADEVIAQEPKKDEGPPKQGPRPGITQIDQPDIKLKAMSIPAFKDDGKGGSDQSNAETTQSIGAVPFLYYNTIQISPTDIVSLNLYYEDNFPKVRAEFRDSINLLKKYPPEDDTKIEVFLNSQSDNIKSIHIAFKYESHQENKKNTYTLLGTVNVPNLYIPKYQSYEGTSFESIRKITKELTIGFNSNITNTEDKMKWLNTGKKTKDFIKDIVAHSYISDGAFMTGYLDFYYCYNYIDIEKEWKRDISNDFGIDTSGISKQGSKNDETKRISRLILTNEPGLNTTSEYFSDFVFKNDSTYQSLRKGYKTQVKYYDEHKKEFLVFNVDSMTSEGDKTIILKGARGDDKAFKENYTTKYAGKIDDDNMHKNYNYAETQNRTNLDNLVKISVDMTFPNPNYNLYRFQKVEIRFINKSKSPTDDDDQQFRLSGEWVIIDIAFNWAKGRLVQKIKAVRKELGKTPEEIKNDPPVAKKEANDQKNENPTPPKPNAKYKVGDVHKLKSEDGETYEITITNVLDNGNEVEGTVKKI